MRRIEYPRVLIELRPSLIDGVGVFAVNAIASDQRIAEGIGDKDYDRIVSWERFPEFDEEAQEKIDAFCIGTPDGFIPPEDLDFNRLSIEWYFNHSCDGNVGFDEEGNFVARRKIRKGEELTYDYALAESNPRFKMACKCDSERCRKVVTGDDWKDSRFKRLNHSYMLPRLRELAPAVAQIGGFTRSAHRHRALR